jgi:hypothetical protein
MARSTRLSAAAALLVAGVCGLTQSPRAQDAPATIRGILCETEAQVRTIVSANLLGADAVLAAYQQLNAQRNSKNEPACSIQDMPHYLLSVPKSIDIGPWPEDGRVVLEAFTLHILVDTIDAWFLYVAPRRAPGSNNGI